MRRYNYEKQVEKWDVLEVTVEIGRASCRERV